MQNFVGKTKCIAGYMKVANSRSFIANQKARNAIFGAENLQIGISKFSAPNIAFLAF